jgi:adsorption protein B
MRLSHRLAHYHRERMIFHLPVWHLPISLWGVDRVMLVCFAPLAIGILLSGLDDMALDVAWAYTWLKKKLGPRPDLFPPGNLQLDIAPRNRIAMLVPLWHEHEVIANMLEHNLRAIRYRDYHVFAGVYPNDRLTQEAVAGVCARFPNVHLAICPHDGPTSKADCLNWIYQHLQVYEEQQRQRFEVVVIHDAEDLIHPDEFSWINFYSGRFDFVQTPVLALPTPFIAFTHGVYCDEFAEYHTRDMPLRPALGGFLPSSGVGTAYRREALEKLAGKFSNRIFEPESLTEDYENGLKLFRLGCSQAFVPLARAAPADFCATREYFPQTWYAALRQRTRWVTGIALQGWQRYGWAGKPGEVYWLWRDRKGLIANPLSFAANVLTLYGLATAMWTRLTPLSARLALVTIALQALRTGVRMVCVARIYGPRFALGVPFRAVYANALNSAATFQAVARYAIARWNHQPLKWLKTDHSFPSRAALPEPRRKLGEILVNAGHLTARALSSALANQTPGLRLGEYLVRTGELDEDSLYAALSVQHGVPVSLLDPEQIPRRIARGLPEHVARRWRVLPFRIAEGNLFLAGPEPPSAVMTSELHSFTALGIRCHLVTPANFEKLAAALLV